MPRGHSKTSKQSSIKRERQLKAFALRKAGLNYYQIGKELGVSHVSAHKYVKKYLEEIADKTSEIAQDVLKIELERLDAMILGLWEKARRGDENAVNVVLRCMKRRAAYLGLDQPDRIALGGDKEGKPIQVIKIGEAEIEF